VSDSIAQASSGDATATPCRTLAEYVRELVARLGAADAAALERLRRVVGTRRARITLDDETVVVSLGRRGVIVRALRRAAGGRVVDGVGRTDRATTLDVLGGYCEVTEAVLSGHLELSGTVDAVARMGQAIELLLDVATRAPALQALARDFVDDPCRAPAPARRPPPDAPAPFVGPPSAAERALLARHDLLPP
jgi:hypothetical protein